MEASPMRVVEPAEESEPVPVKAGDDIRQAIFELIPDRPYIAREVAEKAVLVLKDKYPEEWSAWVQERAVHSVRDLILEHEQRVRRLFRVHAPRVLFGDLVAGLSVFDQKHVVDEEGFHKSVREMTGTDHRFVAKSYRREIREREALAIFHEAVAKKIGSRKTEEVLTEDKYQALLARFTKEIT